MVKKNRLHLTDCPSPGYYGDNCSLKCPQNCHDGYCDSMEGTCPACKPGFIGPRCMGKLVLYMGISAIFVHICSRDLLKLIINNIYPNVVDCIDFFNTSTDDISKCEQFISNTISSLTRLTQRLALLDLLQVNIMHFFALKMHQLTIFKIRWRLKS